MRQRFTQYIFLFFLFLLTTSLVQAQKVAVVLSGGGAKGVCHIGVLKALEEACIPIDYIAGTSMGAIIGGLYAAGYSPSDMENIISSEEFNEWVTGKIESKYYYFFRQSYPDASWMTFRFRYDSVLQTQLPTNIVSPVRMDFAFLELFGSASAAANYNFDSLMVPFRCVAADVDENKSIVLKSGDLGSAIRASMTFPFYFKPIRIDGKLLFDGGMYNNFPSDVAYEDFFPDIIIGSKASSNARPPSDDNVVSQLTNMLMEKSKYDVICESGVMIEPELKAVNVIDFSHSREFIDSGYVAAQRMLPEIRKFVLDSVSQEQRSALRSAFNQKKPYYDIKKYSISGLTDGQYTYVKKLLQHELPRKYRYRAILDTTTLEEVKGEYFRLLAENRVSHTYPQIHYSPELKGYELHIQASRENNVTADFGGNISSKANNEVFLRLQYTYWSKIATSMEFNAYIGRFYNSVKLGGRVEFPSRIPFFLESSYIGNRFNYMNTSNTYFFDYETPVYLKHGENYWDFRFGFPIKHKTKIELALNVGQIIDSYYQTNTFTSKDTLDKTTIEFYSPLFAIESNSLNRKQYANKGERFYSQVRFISSMEEHKPGSTGLERTDFEQAHNYIQANICYEKYFSKRGPYTGGFYLEAMMSFQHLFRNYTSTLLASPGFSPIPEMATLFLPTFRNPVYFAAGQRNILTLWKNVDMRIEGFVMIPYRQLLQDNNRQAKYGPVFNYLNYAGSTSLIYQSPIGPLSVSYSYFGKEEKPYSFFLNIGYILFNRQALN
ncbi:MAG: patatin-like phospholipase family protein [Bacteroidales bacterium]|nr:patatin-like phospholipase family protein [Bacteroidales bacterium]